MKNFILLVFIALFAFGCGGGDSETGSPSNQQGGSSDDSIRPTNPNIPSEHQGTTKNNTRFYSANPDGYKVAVSADNLSGNLTLKLQNEKLLVSDSGKHFFKTTFPAGTNISVSIISSPHLQECNFNGSSNGSAKNDSAVEFSVSCTNTISPDQPFINQINSTGPSEVFLTWDSVLDRDSASSEIDYQIYWSNNKEEVGNKTSSTVNTSKGQTEIALTNLSANETYFIGLTATDDDGNVSSLSTITEVTTLSSANMLRGTPFFKLLPANVNIVNTTWSVPVSSFSGKPDVGNILILDEGGNVRFAKVISIEVLGDSYAFETLESGVADIFHTLQLSGGVAINEEYNESVNTNNKSTAISSQSFKAKSKTFSICRSSESEFTEEELAQITIQPIYKFQPRLDNNLVINFEDILEPSLEGSISYSGEVTLGVSFKETLSSSISGGFTCELAGLPIERDFKYFVLGVPVLQSLSLDTTLSFSFDAEALLNASQTFTATATLDVDLAYNDETDTWETSATPSESYDSEYLLDFAAKGNLRASVKPKITTTFYKTASISLSTESGLNAKLEVNSIGENDPIAKFRELPFVLTELKSDADVDFLIAADFTLFGQQLLSYPERSIYKPKPLRIFDTPLVCTNNSPNKKSCELVKGIGGQASGNRFNLEMFTTDGTNNPVDLSSVQWQVSPNNGFLEVNKIDPRKATFEAYDNDSYVVVASVADVLEDAGRQYAVFNLSKECNYGLGQTLDSSLEQYFVDVKHGYLFPNDIDIEKPNQDLYEICDYSHRDGFNNSLDITSFYAGQLNGLWINETKGNGIFGLTQRLFADGYALNEHVISYNGPSTGDSVLDDHYYENTLIENPSNIRYKSEVTSYFKRVELKQNEGKTYPVDYKDLPEDYTYTAEEAFWDIESKRYKNILYQEDGTVIRVYIGYFEIDDDLLANSQPTPYEYSDSILNRSYYPDGNLKTYVNYETGFEKQCGWLTEGDNDYTNIIEAPVEGFVYKCINR